MVNNFYIQNNQYTEVLKSSPYFYLVKKYFLKKQKIKYKKFKRLITKNVYSKLYKHKIYSLNYNINFMKIFTKHKLNKFANYQFYFYNFSGLLKQALNKDLLVYSLYWHKMTKEAQSITRVNSYYFQKYNINILSNFIISNNSKDYMKSYHTNYFVKINYYKKNLLLLEKIEYNKLFNYNNLLYLNISDLKFKNFQNKNNKIKDNEINKKYNFILKTWWGGYWDMDSHLISKSGKKSKKALSKFSKRLLKINIKKIQKKYSFKKKFKKTFLKLKNFIIFNSILTLKSTLKLTNKIDKNKLFLFILSSIFNKKVKKIQQNFAKKITK